MTVAAAARSRSTSTMSRRCARRGRLDYPDPVEAAAVAEAAGASGITIHLRGDRRHIQDSDLERLRRCGARQAEPRDGGERRDDRHRLPRAPAPGDAWCRSGPRSSRPRAASTSSSHLAAPRRRRRAPARRRHRGLARSSIPTRSGSTRWRRLAGLASGIELNTDAYTRAPRRLRRQPPAPKSARSADMGAALGFRIYAGHGLTARQRRRHRLDPPGRGAQHRSCPGVAAP